MSTRHARTADKAVNERNTKTLKALLQQPDNKYCADCKKKDPRWASWNIGVFVCIRCSGVHRSMGTHISKVKSVDLDTWLPDQVENMVKWGNARASKYWEANLKDRQPSESNINGWIRAKYEHKRWAMPGPIPDPSTLGGGADVVPAANPTVQKPVESPPASKAKQSEFANLDAFLGSPSSPVTKQVSNHSSPPQQLQGADFFATTNNDIRHASSAPVTPAHSRPETPANSMKSEDASGSTNKHKDIKSSILSLYNTPRSSGNSGNLAGQPSQATNSYASNMGNFQQQLSGLSIGPSSGMIPQPPTQQANLYQNVWGGFQEAPGQSAWTDDFSSFSKAEAQPAPSNGMPQGGQFFSMTSQPSANTQKPAQKPNFE
ncbi:hypothetical protein INT43_002222 [Umbelopsis isabellina]|uniref:Arf-GAP domain-containing protein n=1 Tax=Mortierella isabellina TaxID=91625 RepID=A0A8H7Q590_MORIS|nr:hypothetical protein INT43_002222 [Umbelopsis isabellina]